MKILTINVRGIIALHLAQTKPIQNNYGPVAIVALLLLDEVIVNCYRIKGCASKHRFTERRLPHINQY